jgi:hypothetical protein
MITLEKKGMERWKMGIWDIVPYPQMKSGGCRMSQEGDDCACNLGSSLYIHGTMYYECKCSN